MARAKTFVMTGNGYSVWTEPICRDGVDADALARLGMKTKAQGQLWAILSDGPAVPRK